MSKQQTRIRYLEQSIQSLRTELIKNGLTNKFIEEQKRISKLNNELNRNKPKEG